MSDKNKQSLVVSLELAQRSGSVAAKLGEGEIVEVEANQGDRDRDSVMPALDKAINLVGGNPKKIDAVLVSIGPGGFTGLRVAVATAKMISLATGANIVSVETAIGVVGADEHAPQKSLVISAIKNSTCWLSVVDKDHWTCKSGLIEFEEFEQLIHGQCVIYSDSFLPDEVASTCNDSGVEIRMVSSRASSIMYIGLRFLAEGKTIDPNALLPLYPREPEAVRNWKAQRRQ